MAAKSDLRKRELSYLRDALFDFKEENGVVFGYCIGNSYEKIIETVAAISSTCFIRAGCIREKRTIEDSSQFTRCLTDGLPLNGSYSIITERNRIACTLYGNCYNDIIVRDANVCKVCKKDNGTDDWLGCDCCGQFFHAHCAGVDYSEALVDPMFYCPV